MPTMTDDGRMDSPKRKKPPRGKGTDFAYEYLRDRIVELNLAPGAKIDESRLAAELGVSRTPLREAIVRLAGDRLVAISPNHGAIVAPLDALELTQYFESLELAHRVLQHWACVRRTDHDLEAISKASDAYDEATATWEARAMSETNMAFHHAIAHAARNEFMADFEKKLSVLGMRIGWIWYRDFSKGRQAEDVARTVEEHHRIVDAIRERDVRGAEDLAHRHIVAFRDRVFAKLNQSLGNAVSI